MIVQYANYLIFERNRIYQNKEYKVEKDKIIISFGMYLDMIRMVIFRNSIIFRNNIFKNVNLNYAF